MDDLVVLLPSPLLGPATWEPVARLLRDAGHQVHVVAMPPVRSPQEVVDALLAQLPTDRPLVLVPHSGGGLYVAAVAAARDVRAAVFVDAGIPTDAATSPAAPQAFLAFLEGLADAAGLLPGWTQWWPQEDVAAQFPDGETRGRVEAEQQRLPLSYFASDVPTPGGWQALPCGYLGFGETYAEEQQRAHQQGWPVVVLDGGHLHQLVAPVQVAGAVDRLLGSLRVSGRRSAAPPATP